MLLQGDLRGQHAPKTKSRGAGMPWGCTRSVPSPTGHLAPARPGVRWQPTARKPGWTSREGRATAWTGAAGTQGPRAPCPTLGHSGEATQRGRGMRQPATSSMLLASSLVHTGEPARDVKAGDGGMGKPRRTSKAHQAVNEGRGVRGRGRRAQGEGPEGAGRETGPRSPANAPSCPWGMPRGAGARDLSHPIPLA